MAADSHGHVYVTSYSQGPVKRYNVSDFGAEPVVVGTEMAALSLHLSADPETGDFYNDEGNVINVYDTTGAQVATIGDSSSLGSTSRGVAVRSSTKETFALNGTNVTRFGYKVVPYEPIDNPAVKHGVNQAAVHHYEDFQVTPDGRYAMFSSPCPADPVLQNLGHYELYRYDAQGDTLACPLHVLRPARSETRM